MSHHTTQNLPNELLQLNITTLRLSIIDKHVLHVELNVNKVNSMTKKFWYEYRILFEHVASINSIRSIVVSGGDSM